MSNEFIKEGDIIAIQLLEQQEVFGEYKGVVWDLEETTSSKYYKIGRAATVVITALQTPAGIVPEQTLVKVSRNNNFYDEILVKVDNVLMIRKLVPGSGIYNVYLHTVTGLAIPGSGGGGVPGSGPPMGMTS